MKKIFISAFVFAFAFLALATSANAMTPTLSIYSSGNNMATITVSNADVNASVVLYYNTPSYSGIQSAYLGMTNYSGYLTTSVTSTQYNVTSGSSVYVMVNGYQSQFYAWPYQGGSTYNTSTTGLTVSSLTLPVGGSAVLTSTNSQMIYVSSNSNSSIISTSNNNVNNNILPVGCTGGSQYSYQTGQPCYNYYNYTGYNNTSVQLYALAPGTANVSVCQTGGVNCTSMNIVVTGASIVPTPYTPEVLGACYFGVTLRRNMSGSSVQCLQDTLVSLGYLSYGSYTPAYFDLATYNAVVSFQRGRALGADGIVGYWTRNALFGGR